MITRKQYLAGEFSHDEYYAEIGNNGFNISAALLERVKKALASGDEHLNTIPLATWDRLAVPVPASIAGRLKERGDYPTLAGAVCALKAAAKHKARSL